jgi:hypothetical protein
VVKDIIETDNQITNTWDASCYPQQTGVCVECSGQFKGHHTIGIVVISKCMKPNTYKTLILEQGTRGRKRRKDIEERS